MEEEEEKRQENKIELKDMNIKSEEFNSDDFESAVKSRSTSFCSNTKQEKQNETGSKNYSQIYDADFYSQNSYSNFDMVAYDREIKTEEANYSYCPSLNWNFEDYFTI